MAARCFKDNCHIHWAEVEGDFGPAYEGTLQIDADSSLYCSDPEGGLNVKTQAFGTNGNLIEKLADGSLRAALGLATVVTQDPEQLQFIAVASGARTITIDGVPGVPATADFDMTWENDTGSERLVIFHGQFDLRYEVLSEVNPETDTFLKRSGDITTRDPGPAGGIIPSLQLNVFNAQWAMRLLVAKNGGALGAVAVEHFSTSGVTPNADLNQNKSEYRNVTWVDVVPAGGSIRFRADAYFDGPAQTLNVVARPASQLPDARGFRMSGAKLYTLPIRVA